MLELKDKLIVALDVGTLEKAKNIVDKLRGKVKFYKIGNLFMQYGPKVVKMVGERGGKVFLDLKFYDIPNTVQNLCYATTGTGSTLTFASVYSYIASSLSGDTEIKSIIEHPVFMITVHATAGIETLQRAVKGAAERAKELGINRPFIIGVTLLTSENLETVTVDIILERVRHAKDAGLDGVVCSALEAQKIRERFGKNFIIVTPGIRPKGSPVNDQKRVTTAKDAIEAGADYIVVGRPIIEAKDPLKAVDSLLD